MTYSSRLSILSSNLDNPLYSSDHFPPPTSITVIKWQTESLSICASITAVQANSARLSPLPTYLFNFFRRFPIFVSEKLEYFFNSLPISLTSFFSSNMVVNLLIFEKFLYFLFMSETFPFKNSSVPKYSYIISATASSTESSNVLLVKSNFASNSFPITLMPRSSFTAVIKAIRSLSLSE